MPDGLTFVYDRTESDVQRAQFLRARKWDELSAGERAEWAGGLKGSYNAGDLTRVDGNTAIIAQAVLAASLPVSVTGTKTWNMVDIPARIQMERIRQNVLALRNALPMPASLPAVPATLEQMTFTKANDIERILWMVNLLIDSIPKNMRYVNTFQVGGGTLC